MGLISGRRAEEEPLRTSGSIDLRYVDGAGARIKLQAIADFPSGAKARQSFGGIYGAPKGAPLQSIDGAGGLLDFPAEEGCADGEAGAYGGE